MSKFILVAYVLLNSIAIAADQQSLPVKEPPIQMIDHDYGKRDGIMINPRFIKVGQTEIHGGLVIITHTRAMLTAEIHGLTAAKLKGKRIAFQVLKSTVVEDLPPKVLEEHPELIGKQGAIDIQKKVIWIEPQKGDFDKAFFTINAEYTFNEPGRWEVIMGLVDPIKHEWWVSSPAGCTVVKP